MLGARWVQEALESDFFAQLGVLMGILAPRWQDKALHDESEGVGGWRDREELGTFWVGRRQRRGPARGGDLKIPELDSEV